MHFKFYITVGQKIELIHKMIIILSLSTLVRK
jgi:hypothetical protein